MIGATLSRPILNHPFSPGLIPNFGRSTAAFHHRQRRRNTSTPASQSWRRSRLQRISPSAKHVIADRRYRDLLLRAAPRCRRFPSKAAKPGVFAYPAKRNAQYKFCRGSNSILSLRRAHPGGVGHLLEKILKTFSLIPYRNDRASLDPSRAFEIIQCR